MLSCKTVLHIALLVWKCFLIKTTTFHKMVMVSIDAKWCGDLCEWESCGLHNNHSELRAAILALKHFSHILRGHHVLIRTDNSTVVSYIQNNGRTHSLPQLKLAYSLLLWHDAQFLSVRARHAPGHLNLRTNLLSRGAPLERRLKLHPLVVAQIWFRIDRVKVELFTSRTNTHCSPNRGAEHPWE